MDSLENLLKGGFVDNLHLMTSAYFYANERYQIVKYMYKTLDIENRFQLSVSRNHCKVILIETQNAKIIIHGSANLRSSDCFEQIEIEENIELYDFFLEMLTEIHKYGKTIDKE